MISSEKPIIFYDNDNSTSRAVGVCLKDTEFGASPEYTSGLKRRVRPIDTENTARK